MAANDIRVLQEQADGTFKEVVLTRGTFSLGTGDNVTFGSLTANNGTLTASAPVLDLSQTWNNAAVTFTGLRLNVTNTASASASNFADFQVGGTSIVSIGRDGFIGNANVGINVRSTGSLNRLSFFSQGATRLLHNNNILLNESDGGYGWVSSGAPTSLAFDTGIFRGGAGIIEQRNGTNAQESRLYGTYVSASNYQRMTIKSVKVTLSALSGASVATTGTFIPDGAVVVGVTTRVAALLTGATGYTIGDGTDADRWGDITGTAVGTTSDNVNWTAGTIECFTAGGEVTLTAKTANFTAGAIEICVFYLAGQAD